MKDLSALKINCLGASNTAITKTAEKVSVTDVNYPTLLAQILKCEVRNYGVGGTNIAVADCRHDSYPERLSKMEKDADVVILQGDGNDASHGLPLGAVGDSNPKTFCGSLKSCIEQIQTDYPTAKLIVLTGMKKTNPPKRDDGLTHVDFHNAFVDTCRLCGVEPWDFYRDPLLTGDRPDMMPDGLHMSKQGCEHYAKTVAELIARAFDETLPEG